MVYTKSRDPVGILHLDGVVYTVSKAELHVPQHEDMRLLYLLVVVDRGGGFALWGPELGRLGGVDQLHGQRIHLRWRDGPLADDTLGTDIAGIEATSDLNYWHAPNGGLAFREIQIDFKQVTGWRFKCRVSLLLIAEGRSLHHASGEFVAVVDEESPLT